jgi:peptidoglycan/LPS O-acetylase OafA/YrhL
MKKENWYKVGIIVAVLLLLNPNILVDSQDKKQSFMGFTMAQLASMGAGSLAGGYALSSTGIGSVLGVGLIIFGILFLILAFVGINWISSNMTLIIIILVLFAFLRIIGKKRSG